MYITTNVLFNDFRFSLSRFSAFCSSADFDLNSHLSPSLLSIHSPLSTTPFSHFPIHMLFHSKPPQ